jgi:ABC-type glycerol-3-phosphate transport system permease component
MKYKILLGVSIVLILLWTLFPFYSLIVTSITASGSIGEFLPEKITFEYYQEIFFGSESGAKGIWPYMKNSLIVCSMATIGVIVMSAPCAYGFSRWQSKTSHTLFLGYFILRMLPHITLLVPWYFILNSVDMMDTYSGLAFVYFVFQIPVGIWLMKGFFDTIPQELEEAAWIEGATVFQSFRKIVVPLVSSGFSVTAVFVFIYCYIEFMYASIFARTKTVTLPPFIAGFSTPWEIRFQLMLAAALVSTIPMIILFFLVQRYFVKGITGGAFKS